MTVERTVQGGYRIYATNASGQLVSHLYLGYSKREAISLFRKLLRTV